MVGQKGKQRLNPIDKYKIIDKETGEVYEKFRQLNAAENYMRHMEIVDTHKIEVTL